MNQQQPFFSIVIPVYNVDSFISCCMQSLEQQSCKDFEAVIVDDGSTDNSAKIIKEYCRKNSNFRYIYKENAGLGNARNTGLLNAKGKWIIFVDSDDFLEYDCLSHIKNNIQLNNDSYLYLCRYRNFFNGASSEPYGLNHLFTYKKDNLRDLVLFYNSNYNWAVWKMVINKNFLTSNSVYFLNNVRNGEDLYWVIKLFSKIDKLICLDSVLYNYRLRDSGSLSGFDVTNATKWIDGIYNTVSALEKENIENRNFILSFVSYPVIERGAILTTKDTRQEWEQYTDKLTTLMECLSKSPITLKSFIFSNLAKLSKKSMYMLFSLTRYFLDRK